MESRYRRTTDDYYRTLAVGHAAFSPDNRTIAVEHEPNEIWLWDVVKDQKLATLTGHTRRITALEFSPNGSTLASGSTDTTVRLWDVATGRLRVILGEHADRVTAIAFSPDGKTLATGGNRNTQIYLWNTENGTRRLTLDAHTIGILLAFSP